MHSLDVLKLELYSFFFVSLCSILPAQEPLVTNLQVIERQITQMVVASGRVVTADSSFAVIIRDQIENHPINAIVKQQIYSWAKSAGFSTVYDHDSEKSRAESCFTFAFMPLQASIEYHKLKNDGSRLQRQIVTQLNLSVLNPSQEILLAETRTAVFQDTITVRQIERIETSGLLFTCGVKPAESFLAKLFQPLLVTLATAGIVYSFYSFRSR